ncbi:type I restriction enzyme, S subunit [Bifidobacterium criceti]|uniref:Type I restriction enzyme, S subunit n=3 Tax=Bifidobacterium criceti TaxID=1960969 RepID=A0A2A2EBA3_9BIFI|nr:type I restriction enzyme, S subunit [Bifidobacterium criceti]
MTCRTLGQICSFKAGTAFPKEYQGLSQGDYPFIKVKDMNSKDNTCWIKSADNWVSQDIVAELSAKIHPAGSSVFAKVGEAIRANRVRQLTKPTIIDNNMMSATPKVGIDADYLYYLLCSMKLSNWVDGTALPYFKQKTLMQIEIRDPGSVDQQRKVVRLLRLIDDKISLNNQLNDYLEQMCQNLFDRFDNDEDNPLVKISDIADVNPKRPLKKGESALCVEMADLSTRGAFPIGWRTKIYNGGARFTNGDTVLARITPCLENGKAGYVNFLNPDEVAFGSTEFIVLSSRGTLPSEFFYFLSRNADFISYATAHMNGSSGRQRVSGDDIGRYEVRMPSGKQVSELKKVLSWSMEVIRANSIENRNLVLLRDALLPKLMSGEMDVSNIDLTQPTNNHLADC